jgi:hypothetical protein
MYKEVRKSSGISMHVLPTTCSCRHFVCSGQVCLLPLASLTYARVLYYSISYSLFHMLHLLLLSSLLPASCICSPASSVIFPCLIPFFFYPSSNALLVLESCSCPPLPNAPVLSCLLPQTSLPNAPVLPSFCPTPHNLNAPVLPAFCPTPLYT